MNLKDIFTLLHYSLSHPDFNCRLQTLTESAIRYKYRTGRGLSKKITAGWELHPAPKE